MSEFVGEIRAFASRVPDGWLPCDGRSLGVSNYPALFAVLGTSYGGNGETTFNLPDLRGRVTAGAADRPGQRLGETSGLGREDATLIPYGVFRWAISPFGTFPSNS